LVPSALETDGANMNSTARLTGRLVAAARALTGISQSELAIGSGISLEMLRLLESSGAAWVPDDESQALGRALETFGVVTIPEGDGMGAGVRLKFTRQDVRQIGRLESEGGSARSDDVPLALTPGSQAMCRGSRLELTSSAGKA
jgi:transcriptional regulator with XRE-family HTH domain